MSFEAKSVKEKIVTKQNKQGMSPFHIVAIK